MGRPSKCRGANVTGGFFNVLGVPAYLRPHADCPKTMPSAAPMSRCWRHGLWMRRFGSDPQIIGRTITLEGNECSRRRRDAARRSRIHCSRKSGCHCDSLTTISPRSAARTTLTSLAGSKPGVALEAGARGDACAGACALPRRIRRLIANKRISVHEMRTQWSATSGRRC